MVEANILRIPGPSPIPPSVQREMSQPMIGHRGNEMKTLMAELKEKIKPIFGTKDEVLLFTSSGTSALEAAVVNTTTANDEVLVIVTGAFGDRFAKICETYELKVHRLDIPWGEAVESDLVKEQLKKHPNIKVVFSTFCETSTGVLNPIDEVSRVVRESSDALVVVDGVSCVGGVETKMDEWGVDVFITGSQKAMMLPPGLSFIAVSDRAWERINENKQPRFYLDLRKYRNSLLDHSTPFTPGVSLLFGLRQVLTLFEQEGFPQVYNRHLLMMNMVRGAMRQLEIPLLTTDEAASPTVTAIKPDDFNSEELRKLVKDEFGLSLAGGPAHLQGKIVRIGHMGYCTPADTLQIISLLEIGLNRIRGKVQLGEGVAAAQEIYLRQENA